MRRALPLLACLLAIGAARAQQQESLMESRLLKPDLNRTSNFNSRKYSSDKFDTKSFGTSDYLGTKKSSGKAFETRSFLGVNNPWFGRKVFATSANSLAVRSAAGSSEQFKTDAFAVKEFDRGTKADLRDAGTTLPSAAQPRPYLVAPKAQGGVERFTQNLKKDLTIDDVRDLLNKGKGE